MSDSNAPGSPVEVAGGGIGHAATRAFSLLGNETRLGILLALWAAYEPFGEDNAVPFSDLRQRVGAPDSGQFNYHLGRLVGHFVEAGEEGYQLREPGQQIIRTVIAGTGIEHVSMAPAELDMTCHLCHAGHIQVGYEENAVHVTCSACDVDTPLFDFNPAGLTDRTPAEVLRAAHIKTRSDLHMMRAGICPACSGTVEATLDLCETHDPGPDGLCPECGSRDDSVVRYTCAVCKKSDHAFVVVEVIDHPVVVSFFNDRGVDVRLATRGQDSYMDHWELIVATAVHLRSSDPIRIELTFPAAEEALRLVVDGDLDVIESETVTA